MSELINPQEIPAFLRPTEGQKAPGTELLERYLSPSFGKVIQPKTKPPLKPPFQEGDLVILPEQIKVCSEKESVTIVPIFFYPEFCLHNPFGAKTFIADRSLDPESEIAMMCRKRNREDRQFQSDEVAGKSCEYKEHLNFAIVFPDLPDLDKKIVILSFSGGEWKYGKNFASLLSGRDISHFCGNKFILTPNTHFSNVNDWKGLDVSNPGAENRFVTNEAQFNAYVKLEDKLRAFYEANLLQVSYEVESEEEVSSEFA